MRFLLINYFAPDQADRFARFRSRFVAKFSRVFGTLDTEFKIIEIRRFKDLSEYAYRNKQNYCHSILKTLNNFNVVDIVLIGRSPVGLHSGDSFSPVSHEKNTFWPGTYLQSATGKCTPGARRTPRSWRSSKCARTPRSRC